MSSHFKKFVSERKSSSSPVFRTSPVSASSASSASAPISGPTQGSPQLANFSESLTPPLNASPSQIPRGQRPPSSARASQIPNQLGRSSSHTNASPHQQLNTSPLMGERLHSTMSLPAINTQQSASRLPRQIHGAPTTSPPEPPRYAQPQYAYPPAVPPPISSISSGGLVQANAGGKNQTQLIVGIDFVCATERCGDVEPELC
jgi:hypothetical protein